MGRSDNVNVYLEELNKRKNVNVRKKVKRATENRLVGRIIGRLGPEAKKDEAFWHKVAKTLSENQIETGLEIATQKKPAGLSRVKYAGGIYANMMRSVVQTTSL